MSHHPDENGALHESVKRSQRRVKMSQKDGERTMGQNLALIGSLGWLIVMPTVAGVFLGRWIDEHRDSGIFWTGFCIFAGASLGGWFAWKRMKGEKK